MTMGTVRGNHNKINDCCQTIFLICEFQEFSTQPDHTKFIFPGIFVVEPAQKGIGEDVVCEIDSVDFSFVDESTPTKIFCDYMQSS